MRSRMIIRIRCNKSWRLAQQFVSLHSNTTRGSCWNRGVRCGGALNFSRFRTIFSGACRSGGHWKICCTRNAGIVARAINWLSIFESRVRVRIVTDFIDRWQSSRYIRELVTREWKILVIVIIAEKNRRGMAAVVLQESSLFRHRRMSFGYDAGSFDWGASWL